jgi:hypothetical protein
MIGRDFPSWFKLNIQLPLNCWKAGDGLRQEEDQVQLIDSIC